MLWPFYQHAGPLQEGIDGAKMMFKLDGRPIDTFDKEGVTKVLMAMVTTQEVGSESAPGLRGLPYGPLSFWCVGAMIARGATEEDFKEKDLFGEMFGNKCTVM